MISLQSQSSLGQLCLLHLLFAQREALPFMRGEIKQFKKDELPLITHGHKSKHSSAPSPIPTDPHLTARGGACHNSYRETFNYFTFSECKLRPNNSVNYFLKL